MGDPEMPLPDDLLSVEEDVDVDVARSLGHLAGAPQGGLDAQAGGQQQGGGLTGLDLAHQVQEEALVRDPHRFGLVHRRAENRVHPPST